MVTARPPGSRKVTSIYIDRELLWDARAEAARRRMTYSEWLERVIRAALGQDDDSAELPS